MIKVENLSKKYKESSKLALDDVSFELQNCDRNCASGNRR